MEIKIVDSRSIVDQNNNLISTVYTVFCEDDFGSEFLEVTVPDGIEIPLETPPAPPEAYAAFVRLYLEWMGMTENEQIEYTRKNVVYAGYNHKKHSYATGIPFRKSGDEMYGEEFDGYVSEAWASLGKFFTDVDAFAIYLEKNFHKYSKFPMSGDMLRRAAQSMMEKMRKQQIKSTRMISLDSKKDDADGNEMDFADTIPDVTINIEDAITYDDFVEQVGKQITNPVRKQVFDALLEGHKKSEISNMLKISAPAVSKHIKKIGELVNNIRLN